MSGSVSDACCGCSGKDILKFCAAGFITVELQRYFHSDSHLDYLDPWINQAKVFFNWLNHQRSDEETQEAIYKVDGFVSYLKYDKRVPTPESSEQKLTRLRELAHSGVLDSVVMRF